MMNNMLASGMMADYGHEDPNQYEENAGDLQISRQGTILSNNESQGKAASFMANLGNRLAARQSTMRNMTQVAAGASPDRLKQNSNLS